MAESQNEPLIQAPDQTVISMQNADRESSKKAFKVAGFTVLACLLIAGQALTAYFVLSQKSQIGDIEQSNEALRKQLMNQAGGSSGSKVVNVPIHSMPAMVLDVDDKDDPKNLYPIPRTGVKCKKTSSSRLPGFQPWCDEEGNHLPMQCWNNMCWCVDSNGNEIPNTATSGRPWCGEMQGPIKVMDSPSMVEQSD